MLFMLTAAGGIAFAHPRSGAEGSGSLHQIDFDEATCRQCHAAALTHFDRTPHAELVASCARCHGDVAAHARAEQEGEQSASMESLRSAPPDAVDRTCLQCHDRRSRAHWSGSIHQRRGLSCTSCHSVHDPKSVRAALDAPTERETCYRCHPSVRAQSMRTSHHPIREGKLECSSCHDVHDATRPHLLKADSVNELCDRCHTDMRGPFLWEHAPVGENCLLCHTPHGSVHDRLLVARPPFLCQRCHLEPDHPSTLSGFQSTIRGARPSNRMIGRACMNCHQNIHGSNAPSGPYLGR